MNECMYNMYVRICMYVRTYVYVCTYVCTHVYVYTYILKIGIFSPVKYFACKISTYSNFRHQTW